MAVRKTQSESAPLVTLEPPSATIATAAAEPPEEQLADIFEVESIKEISDVPGLEVVKRLSVFEEICPSDLDHEVDGHMQLSNFAGGSVVDGLVSSPNILTSQHSADL